MSDQKETTLYRVQWSYDRASARVVSWDVVETAKRFAGERCSASKYSAHTSKGEDGQPSGAGWARTPEEAIARARGFLLADIQKAKQAIAKALDKSAILDGLE
jgi:hypothetical protein